MDKSLEDRSPEEIERMAAMYQAILNNPETRELGLKATKIVNPKLAIPELDTRDAIAAAVKPLQDRLDEQMAEKIKKDAEDRVKAERAALREQGFSQADVEAIEKLMIDDKIASHASAAKHYKAQQQLAEPTPGTRQVDSLNYSLPPDPLKALKGGRKSLAAWARNAATEAVNDLHSGRVKLTH